MNHRTPQELDAGLAHVLASPRDVGRLEWIVLRPEPGGRLVVGSCELDLIAGAVGDRWIRGFPSPPLPGMPDLDSQLTLINARAAHLVAGSRDRWALAGDQLYVDLDLSDDNLRAGDRIRFGEQVELEITPLPHQGCRKFAARYGEAARAWVDSAERKHLHLRGIYAKVVTAGTVRVGDLIHKRASGTASGSA